jgi:mandelate racemase
MAQPHQTASGTVTESPLVLVDVVTEEGEVGHGIVFTYATAALKPTAELVRNLAPLVEGQTLAPAAIEETLTKRFRLLGTEGLLGMALAGIDMALWDALARLHRIPLLALLGGIARPLPAYGGIGYDGEMQSAKVAEQWARRGFKGVKAKIGYSSTSEDLAVIRAIRNAVGPDVAIMVDYNQCLSPSEAVQRLRQLDDQGLTWIEEPTLAHDYQGHARIAQEIQTPVQSGENWWGVRDMRQAIEAHATDYMMADVMKIGGVTGWMRAAALSNAYSIRLSNHLWPEISTQLLCATPTAHWLEYADWWNPVIKEPLQIGNGMTCLDSVVGTGVEWIDSAVTRFAA